MVGVPLVSYEFFALGKPSPQGSKSFKGLRKNGSAILVESSKGLKEWRQAVALAATNGPYFQKPDPVALGVVFIMPRPLSTPRKLTPPAVKRPDLDKLVRGVLDALSAVSYDDDSQVVTINATKRLALEGEPTGALIWIHEPS